MSQCTDIRPEQHYKTTAADFLAAGNVNGAEECIAEALLNYPGSASMQSQYAALAQAKKNWLEAVTRLETLLLMEMDSGVIHSETYARLVQACRNALSFVKAECFAQKGLSLFPNNVSIQSEYAWNAQTEKNWPAAAERLERLLELQGEHATDRVYVRMAQVLRHLGQLEKAEDILTEGLRKIPASARIKKEYEAKKAYESQPGAGIALKFTGDPRDLLLTTFPGHKSKNVGDSLISHSAILMLQSRNPDYKPMLAFRSASLDQYADGTFRSIIAPGFSISNGVYPELFRLYTDLTRLPDFFPIGCSFQHPEPSRQAFETYEYSKDTLSFLTFITDRSGPLPCRDQLIVELAQRHGIPAVYSGDMAIYDESVIASKFIAPSAIGSVVFTIQHHSHYEAQSFKLLGLVKARFPEAKLYVAFHSKIGPQSQKIADYAVALGFTELHLYGDVKNLNVYDSIDLHIGYRLHGHISFLRRRKPSVLLVEDARSFGLAHTAGTDVGCFEALTLETMEADMAVPDIAMAYIDSQIKDCFNDYHRLFSFVDSTYIEFVRPFFDRLAQKTRVT